MKIHELYSRKKPVFSFEIFPPKKNYPIETVFQTVDELTDLNPDFISVTYGAGGSNRDRTLEIATRLKQQYGVEPLVHLTCVGQNSDTIDHVLKELSERGIENILALRGDPPADQPDFRFEEGAYKSSLDLIGHIRRAGGFSIAGAAYPEGHPTCTRLRDGIAFLKRKVDCGANFLITQLYFDNRVFFAFEEQVRQFGIQVPISVGIMPILNREQIKRMASLCGASIPAKVFTQVLDKFGDNPDDVEKAGIDYTVRQIQELVDNGVDGIHLYSMNKSRQIRQIVENVNWPWKCEGKPLE